MEKTLTKYQYLAFGHHVFSDIPFPELVPISCQEHSDEIFISEADLTKQWSYLIDTRRHFTAEKESFIFQVPGVAVFSIKYGKEILYSAKPDVGEEHIRLYLLGTCMGALLLQKRILPLHGSAIAIDGKAYAIIGDSGAGKSTLAAAFVQKGYKLLTDDVIALENKVDSKPAFVTPSYPQQKLWDNSLEAFNMESTTYPALYNRNNKFAVSIKESFCNQSLPLGGIFELTKSDAEQNRVAKVNPLERLQILYHHTYRNFLIERMELLDWHFNLTAKLANDHELFRICRSNRYFTAPELASKIVSLIIDGEV